MKLREYQKSCVDSVLSDIDKYNKLGVVIPTGGGKTFIFSHIVQEYLAKEDKLVLILSHLSLLTQQTKSVLNKQFPDINVGVLQGNIVPSMDAQVIVATMQTSRSEDKIAGWLGDDLIKLTTKEVGLIIVDECHFLMTPSYEKTLSFFPKAKVVGFTATPYRSAQTMLNYFDNVSYSISLDDLIEKGYLVKPKLNQIVMPNEATSIERISRTIHLYKEEETNSPAVIYLRTIEEAQDCRSAFEDAGISAKTVTSNETDELRDKILDEFRAGEFNILTTVNVLSAGVDLPNLECIFMPYSTKSPTLFMQRVGRALRLFPGKELARVYMYGDTPEIKSGLYRKMLDNTLKAGSGERKTTIYDEKEFLDLIKDKTPVEVYTWTERACMIADRLKELGAEGLYDLFIRKQFPNRYLKHLNLLEKGLKATVSLPQDNNVLSKTQVKSLKQHGFNDKQIAEMNSKDALTVFHIIDNVRRVSKEEGSLIIPTGKFAGRSVAQVPYFYRKTILGNKEKYQDTYVYKLIYKYWVLKQRS